MSKGKTVHVIATQHLDVAWLWPRIPAGEALMAECFERAIEMIEAHPDIPFIFSRSTAWSFWIMEQRYPKLFEKIRRYVAEGKIELCGGEWVEPDHLMPDGEALVRQCACGQWYYQDRFGKIASVCWDPDIFAHAGTLPQILKKAGLDGYYFHRCRPQDEKGRTLHQFLWKGPDGTQIIILSGNWVFRPDKNVIRKAQQEAEEFGLPATHVVTGLHSDRRITMLESWAPDPPAADADPDLPACRWSSSNDVLRHMQTYADRLPVIEGELGFQFTGTYTSNGHIKQANRRVEGLLMAAEKIAAWASLEGYRYPAEQLTQGWRDLCVNQFHDLACGCSHQNAMNEALDLFGVSERRALWTIERAGDHLAQRAETGAVPGADPLVVFNTLAWRRRGEVFVERDDAETLEALRADGSALPAQAIRRDNGRNALLFQTDAFAGLACDVYYLRSRRQKAAAASAPATSLSVGQHRLENAHILAEFDAAGGLKRLYDKKLDVELLDREQGGALLRFYRDVTKIGPGQCWNIGELEEFEPEAAFTSSIEEIGPVRARLRFTRRMRLCDDKPETVIVTDAVLSADSPMLRFEMSGEWHARETMVKSEFNLSFPCETIAAEAPYGVALRPPNRARSAQRIDRDSAVEDGAGHVKERHEPDRPMQKWLDFSDGAKGVAFLNDGKYGYDADTRQVRLSLLRSPSMKREPDKTLGLGRFSFSYAVMPHAGDWRDAELPRVGYEFNNPLLTTRHDRPENINQPYHEKPYNGRKRAPYAFVASDGSSALVTVVKRAEDGDGIILRIVETLGRQALAALTFCRPIAQAIECDLLERRADGGPCAVNPTGELEVDGRRLTAALGSFEIKTVRIIL